MGPVAQYCRIISRCFRGIFANGGMKGHFGRSMEGPPTTAVPGPVRSMKNSLHSAAQTIAAVRDTSNKIQCLLNACRASRSCRIASYTASAQAQRMGTRQRLCMLLQAVKACEVCSFRRVHLKLSHSTRNARHEPVLLETSKGLGVEAYKASSFWFSGDRAFMSATTCMAV